MSPRHPAVLVGTKPVHCPLQDIDLLPGVCSAVQKHKKKNTLLAKPRQRQGKLTQTYTFTCTEKKGTERRRVGSIPALEG